MSYSSNCFMPKYTTAPPMTNIETNKTELVPAKAKETTIMISPIMIIGLCDFLLIIRISNYNL